MSDIYSLIDEMKINLSYNKATNLWSATVGDYTVKGATVESAVEKFLLPSHWLPKGEFSYPEHDCYWLVRKIRDHYGLDTPNFKWVYEAYPTIASQPLDLAERCLSGVATLRVGTPHHLDIALLSQNINADLGTVLVVGNHIWIAYMSHKGAVAEPLERRVGRIVKSYWEIPNYSLHVE
jgi:hypothetical protein